ncbi:hypothetical protein B0920_09275 [Massilia sp. KIM]|nr:hypothetical protein B0920_09275 [Massilia sp. KIM]
MFLGSYALIHKGPKDKDRMGVSVNRLQRLGPDYRIHEFYVSKGYYSNVGEGGGGGSHMCCVTIPKKWYPGAEADVRWQVHPITKPSNPAALESGEIEGRYGALVPVEAYREPGELVVHFFPNRRVRIVVSSFDHTADEHPIKWGNAQESLLATAGAPIKEIFTAEELAELDRENARDKAKMWSLTTKRPMSP